MVEIGGAMAYKHAVFFSVDKHSYLVYVFCLLWMCSLEFSATRQLFLATYKDAFCQTEYLGAGVNKKLDGPNLTAVFPFHASLDAQKLSDRLKVF